MNNPAVSIKGPTGNPGPGVKVTIDTKILVQEVLNKIINEHDSIVGRFESISKELTIEVVGSCDMQDAYLVTFHFHSWDGASRAIVHLDFITRTETTRKLLPRYLVKVKSIAFFNSPGKLEPVSFPVIAEYINRHIFLTGPEFQLSAKELEQKYVDINGGEHPIHTRDTWKKALMGNFTDDGYWTWVTREMAMIDFKG